MKNRSGLRACSLFLGAVVLAQFSACGLVERNPLDDSADVVSPGPPTNPGGGGAARTGNQAGSSANGGAPTRPRGGGNGGTIGAIAVTSEAGAGVGGAAAVTSEGGAAAVTSEGGASACPLATPAIAERSCSGEGFIYEVPDLCLGDGGLSVSDDLLEVYCCGGVKRFCLSGEACPWRSGCVNSAATCSRAGLAPGTDWMAVVYCCEWGGPRDFYCSEDNQIRDEYSENPRY